MKITKIGEFKTIISNPDSRHNYFAWPTAVRLKNGKIAVAASGFRLRHVCPFGKTVISFSEDDGETYTAPAPVIDTVLDDRDGGIATFGESGVIVTSFNNTAEMQSRHDPDPYMAAYIDTITKEDEDKFLGSTFRISYDNGVTFGKLYKSPITSPHGPSEMADGSLLWIGRVFEGCGHGTEGIGIKAYKIDPADGSMEYLGEIENIDDGYETPLSCEPHQIILKDGTIICHIRVQRSGEHKLFTVYQSESKDGGRSWSKPHPVIGETDGAPPHLLEHSSGALICTYTCRKAPYETRAAISFDGGNSWDVNHVLDVNGVSWDVGYPSTVELKNGDLITVIYAHKSENEPAVIMQQKWRLEK